MCSRDGAGGEGALAAKHRPRAQMPGPLAWIDDRYGIFVEAWFRSFCGDRRLVEKTADNVVRTPFLIELFPDAHFVVIKRNECDVVNSYINMWRHSEGRFRSYFVPAELSIPGYPHRHMWCSTLVDGWRDLVSRPVPEIAFAQWREYVERSEEARRLGLTPQWRPS